jgi:hypothetical protein
MSSTNAAFAAPTFLSGRRVHSAPALSAASSFVHTRARRAAAAAPYTARPRTRCAPPPPRAEAGTASPNDGNEGAGEEAAPSSIDWDSDWNKFKSAGMVSDAPPGRAPQTVQEKAARKAVAQVKNVANSLPSRQALFADWRFWTAVLLSLSLFTALVGNSQANQPLTGGSL